MADCKLILILRQLDRFREDDSSAGNFRATEIADIVSEDFFGSLCDWMFDEGIGWLKFLSTLSVQYSSDQESAYWLNVDERFKVLSLRIAIQKFPLRCIWEMQWV